MLKPACKGRLASSSKFDLLAILLSVQATQPLEEITMCITQGPLGLPCCPANHFRTRKGHLQESQARVKEYRREAAQAA